MGAVRGCHSVAILNLKYCYVVFRVNTYVPVIISHNFSAAVYAILSLFFHFQFAVAIIRTLVLFVTISDLACCCFNAMSPVGI